MENKIKVTVEYQTPSTSKFDALMAEYEAAKKYADATVAHYKPLADAAESAKFDAIMEQLETIKEYARRISEINGTPTSISHWCCGRRFDVSYAYTRYAIAWGGDPFTKERAEKDRCICYEGFNLIGRWEEHKVYEHLEKCALELLTQAINNQKNRATNEQNRLYNITKGGI